MEQFRVLVYIGLYVSAIFVKKTWIEFWEISKIKETETNRRSKDEAQIDISIKSEPIPEKRPKESENDESSRHIPLKKADPSTDAETTKARKAKDRYGVQDQSVSLADAFSAFGGG